MAFKKSKPLNAEERKKLLILLAEAQSRGLSVPEIPKEVFGVSAVWPVDSDGHFIAGDGSKYRPYASAKRFLESRARYVLFRAGRGAGKSASGAQKALAKIRAGQSGAVLNPSFENFKISTWPEFKKWIPWDMVVPSQRGRQLDQWVPNGPFVLVFINGAKVICKGLKDPDSARGPNMNWLWYDEAGMDPDGIAWKLANASIRVGHEPQAWATTTPKGKSHWLYRFFESQEEISSDAKEMFQSLSPDRPFIETFRGTIFDNKDNLDAAYYASMLAAYPPGYLREQELNGDWADEGGKIGDSGWFRDKILTSIPSDWTIIKTVRYWDMAGTEKKSGIKKNDPDDTVGSLLSSVANAPAKTILHDQVGGQWEWKKVKEVIKQVAISDGPYVTVVIEQEPGSGGKNQAAEIRDWFKTIPELENHTVVAQRPIDRVVEANPWFSEASQGKFYLMRGAWNERFFQQLDGFCIVTHDDYVTSVSGAYRHLYPFTKRFKKIPFLTLGGQGEFLHEDD